MTVWAGEYNGLKGLPPPPNSYGSDPSSCLAIMLITLQPGGSISFPAVQGTQPVNRRIYFVEGKSLAVSGESVMPKHYVTLDSHADVVFENTDQYISSEVLLLQGRPIGEPVAQRGPFVMNTDAEIEQAFNDYRRTQFGGWPWPEDAVVFPREKGRFALQSGVEERPPVSAASCTV